MPHERCMPMVRRQHCFHVWAKLALSGMSCLQDRRHLHLASKGVRIVYHLVSDSVDICRQKLTAADTQCKKKVLSGSETRTVSPLSSSFVYSYTNKAEPSSAFPFFSFLRGRAT